jgi:hypothetical protein
VAGLLKRLIELGEAEETTGTSMDPQIHCRTVRAAVHHSTTTLALGRAHCSVGPFGRRGAYGAAVDARTTGFVVSGFEYLLRLWVHDSQVLGAADLVVVWEKLFGCKFQLVR